MDPGFRRGDGLMMCQRLRSYESHRNHPALARYLMTMSVSGRLLTGFLMQRLFPRSILHLLYGAIRFDVPGVFAERASGVPHRPDHHLIVDHLKIDSRCLQSLANLFRDGDLPLSGDFHCLRRQNHLPRLSVVALHLKTVILH